MTHYVYRTARGLLRTVHAEDSRSAWNAAAKKHRLETLWNLDGEAWGESTARGAIRDRDVDVEPIWAHSFYFDACAQELSAAARRMLYDIGVGREPTYSCHNRSACGGAVKTQFALVERGLVSGMGADASLTDLGLAFVLAKGAS